MGGWYEVTIGRLLAKPRGFARGGRAQSQVIGAVLIFAFIIAALAAAQVVLVPQSNEELEASHNEQAQQSMSDIRGAIQRSAVVGASQSESIDLGVDYPTRLLLLNPGEGAGTIRTAGGTNLTIENATATDDEVSDFWTGSPVNASSKRIIYDPNYNYYENAPKAVYENSVLYNSFSGGPDIAKSDQDIVDGRRIYLTALEGNKSTSQSGAASVDVKSVSAATETINVQREASGEPIQVTIPTQLSEEVWVQELLVEEIDDEGGAMGDSPEDEDECDDFEGNDGDDDDRFIVNCRYDDSVTPHELTLTFQNETTSGLITYSLKMSKVGVGSGISTPDAEYITDLEGDGADIALNGRQEVVFQVRNKYNNPAEDAEVDVGIVGGTSGQKLLHQGTDITGQSDDNIPVGPDGKVKLTYVAPGSTKSSPIPVHVEAKFGSGGAKDAEVSMEVINASRIDRTRPLLNPSNRLILEKAEITDANCPGVGSGKSCEVTLTFDSPDSVDIEEMRYVFYSADSQGFSGADSQSFLNYTQPSPDQRFEISGGFNEIDGGPITVSGSEDITVQFYEKENQGHEVKQGEFFVISLLVDGERETFFISPTSSSGKSGNK
jgi:hypothetical protein